MIAIPTDDSGHRKQEVDSCKLTKGFRSFRWELGMHMQKRYVGCLVFIVFLLAFFGVWVTYPPARYQEQSQEILKRYSEREAEERALASKSEENAYLDEIFLPFWGRKGIEDKSENSVQPNLDAVTLYADLVQAKDTKLDELVTQKDPKVEQAFAQYSKFYSDFQRMVAKPNFLVPYDIPGDYQTLVPNFIHYRSLVQHNTAYAEYLTLTGKTNEALNVSSDNIRLSHNFGRQSCSLISAMISIACQNIAQQSAVMVFQTNRVAPDGPTLERFLKTLEETQALRSRIVSALEVEFYFAMNTFELVKNKQDLEALDGFNLGAFSSVPGLMDREIRLFQNDYIPILEAVREEREVDLSWASSFGLPTWFLGKHGFFSALIIPNFPRVLATQETTQCRQAFLHLYASILLTSAKTGQWPTSLKALEESGYKPLTGLDLAKVEYKVDGAKMSLLLDHPDNEILNSIVNRSQDFAEWEALAGRTWKLESTRK